MNKKQINKKQIAGIALLIAIVIALLLGGKFVETVKRGTYDIKQAAVTGTMTAHMEPGLYFQNWGDIQTWPNAETFYFTADDEGRESFDQSIEVRYNDGSVVDISGTLRIVMPTSEDKAIELVTVHNYSDYEDLEQELILKVVRNALRLSANLMSVRESYSEKRPEFIFWTWDQIQNGLYETTEEIRTVTDEITGKTERKAFKIIKRDEDGNPLYQENPLEGMGLNLANFEIKKFKYDETVTNQIKDQQKAIMGIVTAKAKALEAEQNEKTQESEGKANVMTAKYEEETIKTREIVKAQQKKEIAVIAAEQKVAVEEQAKIEALVEANKGFEVAQIAKKTASEVKAKLILEGEGESEKKRLILAADGALKQKLETYERVQAAWAQAHSTRPVSAVSIGGGNGDSGSLGTMSFENSIALLVLDKLGLDLSIPKGATVVDPNNN